jgi:hypothetical protein
MFKSPQNINRPPIWFRMVNALILLPSIAWPFIFFGSIFMFDNPKHFLLTFVLFLAVNAYPVYLVALFKVNEKLYEKNMALAAIIPSAVTLICLIGLFKLFGNI